MKKYLSLILFALFIFILGTPDTYAYSSVDYQNKSLCGNFEVAGFHTDGKIVPVSCHSTYESAKAWMKQNGATDIAIMTKVNGLTKIIDANVALIDLSVNPEALTNFYTNSELTGSSYTYMDTGSLYGGVDGVLMDSAYSNANNVWTVKVTTGNFTGWIRQSAYEIVPLTWVKSSSSYTVTSSSIRHNYVAKIQNTYTGSAGSTIGPKPEMLSEGTYYSYDGHYFYKTLNTLIQDAKNNTHNNAVNKNNAYYNYYMYLSNHTRTSYSSLNIDEYIRSSMGITQDVYGNATDNGSSRLYGKGTFFYYAQEKYGVNAILSLSLSRNETGNGRSNLAINKNNGFGLNAVDSSPTESANWYATFSSSILGYASKWVTYGYAHPRDWRYFGPQFGDKWIGMNVKYASDTYWSEKMASNYYSLDKAKGLQDYNYYQLGVVTRQVNAMSDATNSAKFVYSYPEAEDAVVIIGEKQGESINGNSTWYKVVSDLNIDSNFNEISSGDYNWNSYVYIPAAYVKKINTGKNGYISPNNVTEYQNKDYEYDLYVENTTLKPRVGKTTQDTDYYHDSALQSKKGQRLLKNRYVMVYSVAYDKNNNIVSYLVTSDYKFDQKEWIPASALTLVASEYGKVSVTVAGNQYTWVNSVPEDTKATLISGQYTNSYVPVLEKKTVSGALWYRVPVDLSGTTNEFGWTLASAGGVSISLSATTVENNVPTITAVDKKIVQGTTFNEKEGVTANDVEDGNITAKIVVTKNEVKKDVVGTYEVTYQVTDSKGATTTKTIKVTVTENKKPVITAEDIEMIQGQELKEKVTAKDEEDGDLTSKIKTVENTVQKDIPGEYKIVYEVTDSYNQTTRKEIKVIVKKDENPIIKAEDKTLTQGATFKELENVTATDKEDGDLTTKIEVVTNTVDTKKIGEYEVTYQVIDSYKNKTTKTIKVTVVENQKPIISATDKTIYQNETFDELKGISATDPEDGDLTKKITVIENTVNIKELGEYKVIYQVEDSFGNIVKKEIKVTVAEKKLEEKDGRFDLEYFKEKNGNLIIKGYSTIDGINNDLSIAINYKILFENLENPEETYQKNLKRITDTNQIPYNVETNDKNSYKYSWFEGTIGIDDINAGDYKMYIIAESDNYYSKNVVSNQLFSEQISNYNTEKKSLLTRNNYFNKSKQLEVLIRDDKIKQKTVNSLSNQYGQYETINFTKDNKLKLYGNTFSNGMDLSLNKSVTRKIIFEDQNTYKKYEFDLGTSIEELYTVKLPVSDNLSKTKAWYNNSIDISSIPVGIYSIYIYTESNLKDIGELNEQLFRDIEDKMTLDNKIYSFNINYNKRYRVELNVEKATN